MGMARRLPEIEHAMMILEWLRRHSSAFAANIETYLDSSGPITEVESNESAGLGDKSERVASASLGIGTLKGLK